MSQDGELKRLQKKAKALYLKATDFGGLDCGRRMAEHLRPSIGIARRDFSEIWKQIRRLDPGAPRDPFEKAADNA